LGPGFLSSGTVGGRTVTTGTLKLFVFSLTN
jgi:hypothetical protein